MRRVTATQPEEFTEQEHELARQIMLDMVMRYSTPGMLIDIDFGIWVPCPEASSNMLH
jgi:hypothetical protein